MVRIADDVLSSKGDRQQAERQAAFVPRFRYRRLESVPDGLGSVERRSGAVLRADIVGFTGLTDRMVERGVVGAEELAAIIDRSFGRIADIADRFGGEFAVLAGDAAILLWLTTGDDLGMKTATLLATQAALEIQAAAGEIASVRFRVSVGAGEIDHFEVGGASGEWHCVLSGPMLSEALVAGSIAPPNGTVVGSTAWQLISASLRGVPAGEGGFLVQEVTHPISAVGQYPRLSSGLPALIRSSVPRYVLNKGEGFAWGTTWSGEFRTVSAVFIGVKHAAYRDPADTLALLQDATARIQMAVGRLEGELHQVRADEEGMTAIAVFGLPPSSHEDDTSRAVRTALALQKEWGALGVTASTGVATGRVFCAVFGEDRRRMFTLVGPVMNVAARLMQAHTGVVCDYETARTGRDRRSFGARELAPRIVKGRAEPVIGYAPFLELRAQKLRPADRRGFFGRDAEIQALIDAVARIRAGQGGVVIVEGEAGVGKTALLEIAFRIAKSEAVQCLTAAAEEIERSSAFSAWRDLLRDLVAEPIAGNQGADGVASLRAALAAEGSYAPLLAAVLGVECADTAETGRLSGEARAAATRLVLLKKLGQAIGRRPTLIVLEDLHWADSSSWGLLLELAEAQLPCLIIASTRGNPGGSYDRLLRVPGCSRLVLQGLVPTQVAALVAVATETTSAAPDLVELVVSRTSGNPFFVRQLAALLSDFAILTNDGGTAALATSVRLAGTALEQALATRGVPATLEGVIVARLDRLSHSPRVLLNACSILGRRFRIRDLEALLHGTPDVRGALQALTQEDFLVALESDWFEFRHVLLRDVVYNCISFADRRRLHRSAGFWLEANAEGSVGVDDAVLAHHFEAAGDQARAFKYLLRAGESALKARANDEALGLLRAANAIGAALLISGGEASLGGEMAGRVQVLLGQAYRANSSYPEARQHLEAGLAQLGFRQPTAMPAVVGRIVSQSFVQVLHRRLPRMLLRRSVAQPSLREVLGALEGLVESHFYLGDGVRCLHSALRALNLAERAGPSPELARGYSSLGGIVGFAKMRTAAVRYGQRAIEAAKAADNIDARIWVAMIVGISRVSAGDWHTGEQLLRETADLAGRLGDRRRWRDGIGNLGLIAICRGDWNRGLDLVAQVQVSALEDHDARYDIECCREQALCLLHLGRFEDVAPYVDRIRLACERGLKSEEAITRQDLHALAASLAFESGDEAAALSEGEAALAAIAKVNGIASFPNTYCSIFLVARLFISAWAHAKPNSEARRRARRNSYSSLRALRSQARAHRIAQPAYLLARGACLRLDGKIASGRRALNKALVLSTESGMRYEAALAAQQLADGDGSALLYVGGLAFRH